MRVRNNYTSFEGDCQDCIDNPQFWVSGDVEIQICARDAKLAKLEGAPGWRRLSDDLPE